MIREGLAQLRAASEATDFLDLTQEEIPPEEVAEALERPVDNDDGGNGMGSGLHDNKDGDAGGRGKDGDGI